LPVACKKAKITLEDFYEYYDEDETSQFHMKTTELLMDKYLKERRKAKPSEEVLEILGIKEQYLNRWLKRSIYHEFNDRNVQVSVDLIIKGLKQRKNLSEISKITELDIKTIKSYISLGKKGNSLYKPLSDYYESKIIPEKLNTFLEKIKTQSIRKAKQTADIDDDEFDEYYTLGKNGDEKYNDFYNQVLKIKKDKYIQQINKGKSHKNAIKESQLTKEEYDEFKDELDTQLRLIKFNKVLQAIHNNKNSTVAASKAGCSVDDIYNWYVKGKNGDEDYMEFYEDAVEQCDRIVFRVGFGEPDPMEQEFLTLLVCDAVHMVGAGGKHFRDLSVHCSGMIVHHGEAEKILDEVAVLRQAHILAVQIQDLTAVQVRLRGGIHAFQLDEQQGLMHAGGHKARVLSALIKIQVLYFFEKLGGITPRFHAHFAAHTVRADDPAGFQKLLYHISSFLHKTKGRTESRTPSGSVDLYDDLFIAPCSSGAHNNADRLGDASLLADDSAHILLGNVEMIYYGTVVLGLVHGDRNLVRLFNETLRNDFQKFLHF